MEKKAAKITKSSEDEKNFWNLIFGEIMVIWMLVFWDKKL